MSRVGKIGSAAKLARATGEVKNRLDPDAAPPQDQDFDTLDLYHATSGGEAALARTRRDDATLVRTM